MLVIRIVAMVLVLICGSVSVARPGDDSDERVKEALWRGLEYMVRSASDPDNFEEYASDYLFFFADLSRVPDALVGLRARQAGLKLGEIYLEKYFDLDEADAIVDGASALWALDALGMDVEAPQVLLRQAAGRFGAVDYWGFDPARREAPNLDQLIDLLIGFHFTDRIDAGLPVSFAEALLYVPSVEYSDNLEIGGGRYVDQNNLVTHLVYTLSGYASWLLDPALVPRELDYIRGSFLAALMWADPETLSEFTDSLRLLGYGDDDPDIAAGKELLLQMQRPDGSWQPENPEDEYDRYHATWCAMDALRDYSAIEVERGPQDVQTLELLSRWARQYAQGAPIDPMLPVAPDEK